MIQEAELGKRIQQYRINKKLARKEWAERVGITKGYLSKIEKAEKASPVSSLINLANTLNASNPEIFGVSPCQRSASKRGKDIVFSKERIL
jgi:transcriptional regulator with XRE-family HTH domain